MDDLSGTVQRSNPVRVFLHIENRLLREALVRLLKKRSDMFVVGQSGVGELVVAEVLGLNADVLVIALERGGLSPMLRTELVNRSEFQTLLIGLDASEEQFLAAVQSGITGCLLKDASASDVITAIRALNRGDAVCPAQFCITLFRLVGEMLRGMPQESAPRPDLTLRQQQLVGLVAKGLTNKEIATKLNLSEFTVRNHIHRILKQVDAESRAEAVETIRAHGYSINA